MLLTPTGSQFIALFKFIVHQYDPAISFEVKGKGFNDLVVPILRSVGYPFAASITKSHLQAAGSQQSWPNMLAMLHWLVQTIEVRFPSLPPPPRARSFFCRSRSLILSLLSLSLFSVSVLSAFAPQPPRAFNQSPTYPPTHTHRTPNKPSSPHSNCTCPRSIWRTNKGKKWSTTLGSISSGPFIRNSWCRIWRRRIRQRNWICSLLGWVRVSSFSVVFSGVCVELTLFPPLLSLLPSLLLSLLPSPIFPPSPPLLPPLLTPSRPSNRLAEQSRREQRARVAGLEEEGAQLQKEWDELMGSPVSISFSLLFALSWPLFLSRMTSVGEGGKEEGRDEGQSLDDRRVVGLGFLNPLFHLSLLPLL